jgi:hypothetical protein
MSDSRYKELFRLTNELIVLIESGRYMQALFKAKEIRRLFPGMETSAEVWKRRREEAMWFMNEKCGD